MLGRALGDDRWDYILALYLGRFAGLRIHECFRIDTATAEQALRENAITIKGKGGKVRTIPIEDERITTHLKKQLERTERGQKLLVPDGMPTDRAIHQLQLFIYSNRGDFQEDANRPPDLPWTSAHLRRREVPEADRRRYGQSGCPLCGVPVVGP